MKTIAENIAQVQTQIAEACARVGRSPTEVTLVAVSKHRSVEAIAEAARAGLSNFGENRVEEARTKLPHINLPLTWHMIGHLQSRKARAAIPLFDVVQSVDSVHLAARLARFVGADGADGNEATLPVLLQVNVSGETSKYGWEAARWEDNPAQRRALWDDVGAVLALPQLRVMGLMTMAPIVSNMEEARPVFTALRRLRAALAADFPAADWAHLSMGMTDDYPVAVEEGATIVRIGRAIFEIDD